MLLASRTESQGFVHSHKSVFINPSWIKDVGPSNDRNESRNPEGQWEVQAAEPGSEQKLWQCSVKISRGQESLCEQ